jgi:hypothetical protein
MQTKSEIPFIQKVKHFSMFGSPVVLTATHSADQQAVAAKSTPMGTGYPADRCLPGFSRVIGKVQGRLDRTGPATFVSERGHPARLAGQRG